MQIEVLGCGGAFDETSTAFLVDGVTLIDCGLDVVKQLIKRDVRIRRLLITHIHQDHVGGIEALLYNRVYVQEDQSPLMVVAPNEFLPYFKSLAVFKNFGMSAINFVDASGVSVPINAVVGPTTPELTAFRVKHSVLECYGYRMRDMGSERYVMFTGDTDTVVDCISIFDKRLAFVFHDMGWEGLPPDSPYKVHPTEVEVWKKYGPAPIIGVHTSRKLKFYKQALTGQIFGVS